MVNAVRRGGARLVKMESRRPVTLGVSITFFVIASVFVALRFVSRVFVVRRVGLHDYLMLLAWVRGLFPAWTLHVAGDGAGVGTFLIWFRMRPWAYHPTFLTVDCWLSVA